MILASTGGGDPWAFQAHPDAWLIVAALAGGYVLALRRLGPRLAPGPVVSRRQAWQFGIGVLLVWGFADWPVHDISEGYLFSLHMVQHTVFSLVAPAFLLLGTPDWLLRWLVRPPAVNRVLRKLCRPIPATLLFNGVIVISHWPKWVDFTVQHEPAHFGAHFLLFSASVVMWLPVLNRLPELPVLSPPARMLYLFLQSIVPTVPASFLAFAERPMFKVYARAPRITSMSAVEDQQVAGAVMKIGGATLIWIVIVVMFFRWYQESQRDQGDILTWEDVERELERSKPAVG
ncbi:MAG: cytochrome c oxidase assembly protein [Actinobacteria bacterium]|nr:cytochrome c oxidase assembly protein [Actinomycetota bacterium]